MNSIKINLFVLLIVHILPFVITQLLISEYSFRGREKGTTAKLICTAANVILNGLVLYICTRYFDVKKIIDFTCSYQDISRLATSNIISLAIAVLLGVELRSFAGRYYKDEQSFRLSGKCVLLLFLAAIPIILGYFDCHEGAFNLEIFEICRKTTVTGSTYFEDGEEVCYVTLRNNGLLSYELGNMYLSDDAEFLKLEQFPRQGTVAPNRVYRYTMKADALDIKRAGGTVVCLSDRYGMLVDSIEVPALKDDEGYFNSGTGWYVAKLTAEEITVAPPVFSQDSGFYDNSFNLVLTSDEGTTIYYTIDSSNPTEESSVYSRPIRVYDRSVQANKYRSIRNVQRDYLNQPFNGNVPVDKCFVVRAMAVDSDGNCSDIVTKSYFIGLDKYKERIVLSLVCDPYSLFDSEYGIYVTGKAYDEWYQAAFALAENGGMINADDAPPINFFNKGREWERESNLEVFDDTELVMDQPVGIRIQGNASRDSVNKRFSIYSRKVYGATGYFEANLVNDFRQHSLFLRQGQGGDLHVISQVLGRDRDVLVTDFIEVDLFLNGEYWYTSYLYEKFAEQNIAEKYGLSKNNVVTYRAWKASDGEEEEGKNSVYDLWRFADGNDMAEAEAYQQYSEMLDIQSYIDWYCINVILYNRDYSETANTMYWHTVVPENEQEGDARWRLALYDMDAGWNGTIGEFDGISAYEMNSFSQWSIYKALKENEEFRKQFVLTFMDLINYNFSVDNIVSIMQNLGIRNQWYQLFFQRRPDYIVPYLAEEFALTGTQETVTISSNISGSPVTLNTISPELRQSEGNYTWSGTYFTDYPVTVTANAPNFSHWYITTGGSVQKFTDATIEIPVSEGGVQIYAAFK